MSRLVSVLLPVRNGLPHVRSAIESILSQTWRDLEIVVVDDGSTDGSADAVRSLGDHRIRLVQAPGNGLVHALNFGISQCRGDMIARMDADDVSVPHRLEAQVTLLDSRPDLVAVGSSFAVLAPDGRVLAIEGVPPSPVLIRRALLLRNPLGHGTMLMRRDGIERVGGYMQRKYVEDLDLWIRLLDVGDIAAVPDILYFWRNSPEGVSARHGEQQTHAANVLVDGYRSNANVPPVHVSDVIEAVTGTSHAPSRRLRYAIVARIFRDELELRQDRHIASDGWRTAARLAVLLPVVAGRRLAILGSRTTRDEVASPW
jgi:glycosyltransferase involved in cell wall biosynthesis